MSHTLGSRFIKKVVKNMIDKKKVYLGPESVAKALGECQPFAVGKIVKESREAVANGLLGSQERTWLSSICKELK